ncbi:MAG: carboxypeptidase regulatory-like domain-containing protein [Pyrinomonadaceae bacterium]
MRKNLIFISSIVLSVLIFSASTFAQSQFGEISGTVADQNGAVVPNAAVTVTGVSIGFNRTTTTDSNGFYAARQLPPGNYNVSVAAVSGFTAQTVKNQLVVLENTTTVNFTMSTSTSATVDVSAGDLVAPVDSSESKVQTNVSAAKIELLPKGVDFTSLLKTAPGTRGEGLAGGFSIDGASGSENVFVIDGQEVSNFRTGTLNGNNAIPTQFVQEVQIKSSGFEAEFGGATGGVISVVTKGGSNDWHGEFGSQFATQKLNGDPRPTQLRFTNGSGAAFLQRVEYFNTPKNQNSSFFPTANINGPVIKDKMWFSASYTPQLFNFDTTTNFYNNFSATPLGTSPARTLQQTQKYTASDKYEYAFARIDAAPTNTIRVSSTFLWNPIIREGNIPFGTTSFGGTPASLTINGQTYAGQDYYSRLGGRQNSNNFTAQVSWTPLSSVIASARFSRGFLNEKIAAYFVPTITRYRCLGLTTVGQTCSPGAADPANSQTNRDVSIRTNYEADFTYFSNRWVRQEIKGGYQRFKILNDVDRGYKALGIMDIYYGYTIQDLGAPSTPNPLAIGAGELIRFGTVGKASNTNQSVYIQDKVQFGGRFTVNAGVRFEKEDLPSFNGLAPPIAFGWGDKIAPRLGFAFGLNKAGTSKIFGSYGKFYDRLKFELPRGSFGGDFYRIDFFDILPGQDWRSFTLANVVGNFNDAPGGRCPTTGFIGSGFSRCQFDYRIASNDPNATIYTGKVDPNAKPFQQDEFTVGMQHELSRNFVLSSRFVYKDVKEAIEDAGIFNLEGSEAYIIGNPGSGLHLQTMQSLGYAKAATPQRNYKAWDISLDRRLSNNYYFNMNYTYSRLYGNYSGLASSDEAGRTSPGVNRFFDLPYIGFTAKGQPDNGLLGTDRPHVFNAYGAYIFDWRGSKTNSTELGAYTTFQSGTPQSTLITFITPIFLNGRGDMGRTEMLTQTDFSVSHKYKFGRDSRFTVAADLNILNLFDEANVTSLANSLSAVSTNPGNTAAFGTIHNNPDGSVNYIKALNDFTSGALYTPITTYLNGTASALNRKDARYGLANGYQGPRSVRFGLRLIF